MKKAMAQKICFLIDDDLDDQEIFDLALRQVDHSIQCRFASDGAEALEKLTSAAFGNLPDYIFLDLNMPRMNGKQFLREIKKRDGLRNIPVIIFSTSSEVNDIEETKLLGAEEFIVKPPYMSDLTKLLATFLSKKQEII